MRLLLTTDFVLESSAFVERCLACKAVGVATRGALPCLQGRGVATRGALPCLQGRRGRHPWSAALLARP